MGGWMDGGIYLFVCFFLLRNAKLRLLAIQHFSLYEAQMFPVTHPFLPVDGGNTFSMNPLSPGDHGPNPKKFRLA